MTQSETFLQQKDFSGVTVCLHKALDAASDSAERR